MQENIDYQEGYGDAKADAEVVLKAVQEKLGWLLFNLGKGKTDAARNLAIGALGIIDEARGTDYAQMWGPRETFAHPTHRHHPHCVDHDHEGQCTDLNAFGGGD